MENVTHWTQRSTDDFVYNIASDFVGQLETKMEDENISRRELAARLNRTDGRVSQVLNNPGNLGLRVSVEHARALGMKVSLIAYDDDDPNNARGPINPDVFVKCWERAGRPSDLFEAEELFALPELGVMETIAASTYAIGQVGIYAGAYSRIASEAQITYEALKTSALPHAKLPPPPDFGEILWSRDLEVIGAAEWPHASGIWHSQELSHILPKEKVAA